MKKRRGFLGLGSNLGEREDKLRNAIEALNNWGKIVTKRISHVYETAPVGMEEQPSFLNLVVEIETELSTQELFIAIKTIERQLGRRVRERWGPREIDIDILLLGDERIEEEEWVVPHPRMTQRAFVMVPLAELEPEMIVEGERAKDIATRLTKEQEIGGKFSL